MKVRFTHATNAEARGIDPAGLGVFRKIAHFAAASFPASVATFSTALSFSSPFLKA